MEFDCHIFLRSRRPPEDVLFLTEGYLNTLLLKLKVDDGIKQFNFLPYQLVILILKRNHLSLF